MRVCHCHTKSNIRHRGRVSSWCALDGTMQVDGQARTQGMVWALERGRVVYRRLWGRSSRRRQRWGFRMLGRAWICGFSNTLTSKCNGALMGRSLCVQHEGDSRGAGKRP
eukprot:2258028-Amphidinium_carterae.5